MIEQLGFTAAAGRHGSGHAVGRRVHRPVERDPQRGQQRALLRIGRRIDACDARGRLGSLGGSPRSAVVKDQENGFGTTSSTDSVAGVAGSAAAGGITCPARAAKPIRPATTISAAPPPTVPAVAPAALLRQAEDAAEGGRDRRCRGSLPSTAVNGVGILGRRPSDRSRSPEGPHRCEERFVPSPSLASRQVAHHLQDMPSSSLHPATPSCRPLARAGIRTTCPT